MTEWNVPGFFNRLGGTGAMHMHCIKHTNNTKNATPPTYACVALWRHRQRIPANWLPVVVKGLLADGFPVAELFA